MKKNDIILALVVLLIAGIGMLLYFWFGKAEAGLVKITVDGRLYGTYSLEEDREIRINETNTVVIRGGKVDMIWAECPDQICVEHQTISKNKETIVCLPNKVIVEIVGSENGEMDAVSK